jgi:hypothetical protein
MEQQSKPHADEVSTTEARQGVTGHNVRYVLALSFGGAVLALAIVWLVFLR